MTWRLLSADPGGVRRYARPDGKGGLEIKIEQDTTAALDRNKAMATHNDGYNQARDMKRVAHIPDVVALKWLIEEGWWIHDPGAQDKLAQKLNDPDWAHLRTAEGRVGFTNGIMR
ncbi:hypothetical protein [Caulobacter segnis]